jgi:hydrogen cyanide synthase HcnC
MSRIPDVVVVGGGVIGCAVAWELARRRVSVELLDKSLPGRATSASAGGLWPVGEAVGLGCGVIYHAARSKEAPSANGHDAGPEPLPCAFRDFLIQSNALFPVLASELREATGIDIEFAPAAGLLFVIENEREWAFAERTAHGLPPGVRLELLTPAQVAAVEPRLRRDVLGGAQFPGEHQVNPMLLAEAFKRAAIARGAVFRPQSRVTGVRREGDRVVGVELGDEVVTCGVVVNAAGAWAGRLAATADLNLPVFPVRGQIVLTERLPRILNACLSTSACYLLQKAHGEVLIGSTTERVGFDVSVTPGAVQALAQGAARAVPLLRRVRVKRLWAGLRPGTPDELPVLGPVEGLAGYVNATGGFRTGIVASPLTGQVVAEHITGETSAVPLDPFLADRFHASPAPAHA